MNNSGARVVLTSVVSGVLSAGLFMGLGWLTTWGKMVTDVAANKAGRQENSAYIATMRAERMVEDRVLMKELASLRSDLLDRIDGVKTSVATEFNNINARLTRTCLELERLKGYLESRHEGRAGYGPSSKAVK